MKFENLFLKKNCLKFINPNLEIGHFLEEDDIEMFIEKYNEFVKIELIHKLSNEMNLSLYDVGLLCFKMVGDAILDDFPFIFNSNSKHNRVIQLLDYFRVHLAIESSDARRILAGGIC